MFPMGFVNDNQSGRKAGTDRSEEQEQRANPAFHGWLDRKRAEMLPAPFQPQRRGIFVEHPPTKTSQAP